MFNSSNHSWAVGMCNSDRVLEYSTATAMIDHVNDDRNYYYYYYWLWQHVGRRPDLWLVSFPLDASKDVRRQIIMASKSHSDGWFPFEKNDENTVQGKLCSAKLSHTFITNIIRYLLKCVHKIFGDNRAATQTSIESLAVRPKCNALTEKTTKLFAEMVVKDLLPISFRDREGLLVQWCLAVPATSVPAERIYSSKCEQAAHSALIWARRPTFLFE